MIRPIFANWFFQLPTLPLLLFSHQWAGPVKILLRQLHCSKSELPLNVNNYYKIVLYLKYFEIIGRRSLENPERHKGSLSSTSSSPKSGKSHLLNFRPNRRPPHKCGGGRFSLQSKHFMLHKTKKAAWVFIGITT
jgi:hypothetical protein